MKNQLCAKCFPQVHNKMMLLRSKLWSNEEPFCGANRAPGASLRSQNRGQGVPKWEKIQNDGQNVSPEPSWEGPVRAPEAPVVTFGCHFGCQGPAVGDFGHHCVVRLAARTSRFLIFVATSFFLDLIINFYWFLVWNVGWIFMFSIAGGASCSSMILIRFFLSLRIALCIGKTSAKCVLHNKNKGFYTFNVFRTKSIFYIFYRFRHRFRDISFYDFHNISKLLEV